ncbi:hypothetical protein ACFL42_03375 [Candidatus Omnitrophota bacterium]
MFESINIHVTEKIAIEGLLSRLVEFGYTRCKRVVEVGDFSILGENIVIYPVTFEYPVRIELSGSLVERIRSVDPASYETISEHISVIVIPIKLPFS